MPDDFRKTWLVEQVKKTPLAVWVVIGVLVLALYLAASMFRYADCEALRFGDTRCFDRWTGKTVFR